MEGKQKDLLTDQETKEESVELVDNENGVMTIPAPLPASIAERLKNLEDGLQFYQNASILALKMTKPSDWVDQGGTPYLMEKGCQRVKAPFGISYTIEKPERMVFKDDKGEYSVFVVHGVCHSKTLDCTVETIGTCSTRDKFFGTVRGQLLPADEIDITVIMKKASTNCETRLIKKCVGLSNVTFDDLTEASLDISKITKVEYKKGAKKASAQLTDRAKEKRTELWKWLMEMTAGNEAEAKAKLKEFSAFKGREGEDKFVDDIDRLNSEKWIHGIHAKVKKEYDDAMGKFE